MNNDLHPKVFIAFCKPWRRTDRRRRTAAMLTRALTRSDLTHVAVSDGEAVISPTFEGVRYYSHLNFFQHFPTIDSTIAVRVDRVADLGRYDDSKLSITRSLLKHLTAGLAPADDCVTIASSILRYGGVNVPRYITSPIALRRYLIKHNQKEQHGTDPAHVARSNSHALRSAQAASGELR